VSAGTASAATGSTPGVRRPVVDSWRPSRKLVEFTQLREVQMADQSGRSQLEILGSMKMMFPCFPS
jgi:hypothetical protein